MKNLLMSTALILSTATFASAAAHSQLAMQVDNSLATMNMNVDVDSLTAEQVQELYQILTSADGASDKGQAVRAVLNDQNVMFEEEEDTPLMITVPRSQLRAAVLAQSGELGLTDMRIRMLDDEKLTALYLIATGSAADKRVKAEAVVN